MGAPQGLGLVRSASRRGVPSLDSTSVGVVVMDFLKAGEQSERGRGVGCEGKDIQSQWLVTRATHTTHFGLLVQ